MLERLRSSATAAVRESADRTTRRITAPAWAELVRGSQAQAKVALLDQDYRKLVANNLK
jgi:hypothetical protein